MEEGFSNTPYVYKKDHIVKNNFIEEEISYDNFLKNLKIEIFKQETNSIQIDLINCNYALANALRRVIISEIKTFSFHNLFVSDNNTIFSDEYIAHRIGLIPIYFQETEESGTSKDVECILDVVNKTKENISVFSQDIKSNKSNLLIKKDVLICKLAPNHRISIKLRISEGTGKDHAKWSPVALCSYRLMPQIRLLREFVGEDAYKLQKCFSKGVIEIETVSEGKEQFVKAVVVDPRKETMSREALRHFSDEEIELGRVKDYFIFEIETLMEDPLVIFKKGILQLKQMAIDFKKSIE